MRVRNREHLTELAKQYRRSLDKQQKRILVCGGTGCIAGGSLELYEELKRLVAEKGLLVDISLESEKDGVGIKKSGCHGFCEAGPLVRIEPSGYLYLKVKVADCAEIIEKSIVGDETVDRLMYRIGDQLYRKQEEIPFYEKQKRVVLEHCGHLDAERIEEYIAIGGYGAFAAALEMTPQEICNQIQEAGLRGRGGGGFETGKKWKQVLAQEALPKYVVCNGDEGDPGAFMDRSIMEGDPHRLIEGMLIAAVATGASHGYIYVRAEYPMAVERLHIAIDQAQQFGLLGENILGKGFSFDLHINQGAGAFVCGEGSALTASIEGERGMPRVKPPRTVEQGLFGKPTVLNNVETFANVPTIISGGVQAFRACGTHNSPGTKAFALTGNVVNTGLIEVPMGTTLREIVFDIGGGIRENKNFKAVQIGGPSGGCLCNIPEHLDLGLDFDSLQSVGAMIGSGGLVVMDEDTCMVEVARFFMSFTQRESCGKCVPCREGTKRMLEILEKIVAGNGTLEDLKLLEDIADMTKHTALCGLGKTAANPVLSTLKFFRSEYEAHVVDKTCPTKTCKGLRKIVISPELCKGCSKCSKVCPVTAIAKDEHNARLYRIDQKECIRCGACVRTCPFNAILEA